MRSATNFVVVLVTAPDIEVARRLSTGALRAKLVACANLVPGIESHYWWQGRIDVSAEVLCVFKTTRAKLAAFERFVLAKHPYDTPEILALTPGSGTERYLKWLAASLK